MGYELTPYGVPVIGRGGSNVVYRATDMKSGRLVAIKKSRVSKSVQRPTLQYETRILQLLRGHPSIPIVFGYGHLTHFEYMALELLGPNLAQMKEDGACVTAETVIRIVKQMLAGLSHIHSYGIVHRDIKPENMVCFLDDPSRIKIIDFGISKPFPKCPPPRYDPLSERRHIIGTLYWTSVNAHNGIELSPRDDVESLAYVALFLLCGTLPWKPRPRFESQLRSQEVVRILKSKHSGGDLSLGFPEEYGRLLSYSRTLEYGQSPDYPVLLRSFAKLSKLCGYSFNGPLDWTPNPLTEYPTEEPSVFISDEAEHRAVEEDSDSYCGVDIDMWKPRGERDKSLTLPERQAAQLDRQTPLITEVIRN